MEDYAGREKISKLSTLASLWEEHRVALLRRVSVSSRAEAPGYMERVLGQAGTCLTWVA